MLSSVISRLRCFSVPKIFNFRRLIQNRSYKSDKVEPSWKTYFLYAATSFCSVLFIDNNVISFTTVTGCSMQPVFNPAGTTKRDVVLVDRLPLIDHTKIRRGDIIIYRATRDPSELNIKRVVGLEGDVVKTVGYKQKKVKVPKGHCWMEGDNLAMSDDSNKVGPIPYGLMRARATHIVYPRYVKLQRKLPHDRIQLNLKFDPEAQSIPLIESS